MDIKAALIQLKQNNYNGILKNSFGKEIKVGYFAGNWEILDARTSLPARLNLNELLSDWEVQND